MIDMKLKGNVSMSDSVTKSKIEYAHLDVLYQRLLSVSDRQIELLSGVADWSEKETASLNNLFAERELLMNEIDAAEKAELTKKQDAEPDITPVEFYQQEYLAAVRDIVEKIIVNDQRCAELLRQNKNRIGARMAQVRKEKQISSAYQQYYPSNQAWFYDKKK